MKFISLALLAATTISTAAIAADPINVERLDIAIEQPFDWTGIYVGAGAAYNFSTETIDPAIYTGVRVHNSDSFVGVELELSGTDPMFDNAMVTGRAGIVNADGAVYVIGGANIDLVSGAVDPVIGAGASLHLGSNADLDLSYTTMPMAFDDHRVRVGLSFSF